MDTSGAQTRLVLVIVRNTGQVFLRDTAADSPFPARVARIINNHCIGLWSSAASPQYKRLSGAEARPKHGALQILSEHATAQATLHNLNMRTEEEHCYLQITVCSQSRVWELRKLHREILGHKINCSLGNSRYLVGETSTGDENAERSSESLLSSLGTKQKVQYTAALCTLAQIA